MLLYPAVFEQPMFRVPGVIRVSFHCRMAHVTNVVVQSHGLVVIQCVTSLLGMHSGLVQDLIWECWLSNAN